MKSLDYCVMLITVALVAFDVVTAQRTCTRATCPEGPVTVYFPNTDCLGEPEFETDVYGSSNPMNTCLQEFSLAFSYNVTSEGLERYMGYGDACTKTDPTVSYTTHLSPFYVCQRGPNMERVSQMFLPSVNATYQAPQDISVNTTLYPDISRDTKLECPSPDNCTFPGSIVQSWRTFSSDTCEPRASNTFLNRLYNGTCYVAGDSYQTFECGDENTSINKFYLGKGCDKPYFIITERKICSPSTTRTETIHCTAAPLPPPSTPTAPIEEPAAPIVEPTEEPASEPNFFPSPTSAPDSAVQPVTTPTNDVPTSFSNTIIPSHVLLMGGLSSVFFFI